MLCSMCCCMQHDCIISVREACRPDRCVAYCDLICLFRKQNVVSAKFCDISNNAAASNSTLYSSQMLIQGAVCVCTSTDSVIQEPVQQHKCMCHALASIHLHVLLKRTFVTPLAGPLSKTIEQRFRIPICTPSTVVFRTIS